MVIRDANVEANEVVFTGSYGIMMNFWFVDFFGNKTHSDHYDIAIVVESSAINCGISSPKLYYIFVKSFIRNFIEFIQLTGRLKRTIICLEQDQIHIWLSLPHFSSIHFTILSVENSIEQHRQLDELWIVKKLLWWDLSVSII